MANTNTLSSFEIPVKDAAIAQQRMEAIERLSQGEDDNLTLPVELFGANAKDIQAEIDGRLADAGVGLGFAWSVRDGAQPALGFYHDEDIEVESAVLIAQIMLGLDDDDTICRAEWANTCSRPRVGEFGGGAVAFNRHATEWGNTADLARKLAVKLTPAPIDFDVPPTYIEWHVIDNATHRSIERADEPDHALTHRAVAAGTAYVVEATVEARILKHRIVTEDTIGEDE